MIAGRDVHPHQPVVSDAQKLVFFVAHELDDEQRDAKFGERLPRFDVVHLCLHQRQVLEVRVRLEYALNQLRNKRVMLYEWIGT